jgi:hypothetical protein
VNKIWNTLAVLVKDPTSNNILCNALEVCNKGGIRKKTQTPFNCVLLFHFQKMQHRFRRIVTCYRCRERVVEDVYCMTATSLSLDFGVGLSYAVGTSSAGAGQDDYPDLGLDSTAGVLS